MNQIVKVSFVVGVLALCQIPFTSASFAQDNDSAAAADSAAEPATTPTAPVQAPAKGAKGSKTKTVYLPNQTLDFEGLSLEGELKAPGEFYFQNRNQERFDNLTKRRLNFRREMMRDSIQSN